MEKQIQMANSKILKDLQIQVPKDKQKSKFIKCPFSMDVKELIVINGGKRRVKPFEKQC